MLLWAQIGGLAAVALVVLARGEAPHDAAVLLAIPAAISGTLGLYAYYRGMAIGAMARRGADRGRVGDRPGRLRDPTGDRPVAAAVRRDRVRARRHRARVAGAPGGGERRMAAGVGLALLAAIGFGFYFPPMHAAGKADPLLGLADLPHELDASSLVAVAVARPRVRLGGWKLAGRARRRARGHAGQRCSSPPPSAGRLESLTSVLASLYPVVTVMLAAFVLHERVAPAAQRVGVVLALDGVG